MVSIKLRMIEQPFNIAKPWIKKNLPKKILVIRLQAMGDVTITLPYVQYLRNKLPVSTKIDFLTRSECEDIPGSILLFNKVFSIKGGRNFKKQFGLYDLLLVETVGIKSAEYKNRKRSLSI